MTLTRKQGSYGSLAELITAYEQKDPPFEEDTAAQNVLRRTFPVPVVVSCGALVSVKVIDFIEDIAAAETTKDAADVLSDFLESKVLRQLTDFAETMMLIRHAWDHCCVDEDGKVWISTDEEMN
jgi:hypothetical protein